MVRRGFAFAAVMLIGQVIWARFRGVPSFEGLDPSGTFGESSLPTLRILIVGDSTVTGPGLGDTDQSWPRIAARHLTDRYRVELTCLAEGGATSGDVLESQLLEALASHWDVSIISVGSNDVLRVVPVWRFAARLDAIVAQLSGVSEAIILFGIGDLGSIPRLPFPLDMVASGAGRIADRVHRRVAGRHQVAKIDQWRLTTAAFNSGRHMFAPDLFHPSAIGHQAWADALIPALEAVVGDLEESR